MYFLFAIPLYHCSLPESTETTAGEYRHQWRNYFRDEIFPRLMALKPDMIFISAGFDAHKKDVINSGYISLVEEDFDWVTQGLVRVGKYKICDLIMRLFNEVIPLDGGV